MSEHSSSQRNEKTAQRKKGSWRIHPDEEYIWSMRFFRAIGEANKAALSGSDSEIELQSQTMKKSEEEIRIEKIEKQIKLFASFLPDAVLEDLNDYQPREIDCCMLYGRIKGMHTIGDKFFNMKADSKVKLRNQLNQFFSMLVQEILFNGGDILKFTPSALGAIWKSTKDNLMMQNVHIAIDCALVIQKQYAQFTSESGEKLKVDFGITAGPINFSLIGSEIRSRFVIFGACYEDIRKMRKKIDVGDIIISPRALQCIDSFEYMFELIKGSDYCRVMGLTQMWKQVKREVLTENISATRMSESSHSVASSGTIGVKRTEDVWLRPLIEEKVYNNGTFLDDILKFFPERMGACILADESLDNLIEKREIVVVAILMFLSSNKNSEKLETAKDIYEKISRRGHNSREYVNNLSIIGNTIMITIIFGLKGYAHVSLAKSALNSTWEIKNLLKTNERVTDVGVGITSGEAYFTIIGHGFRQDTVLFGRSIMDASNIAINFPGKIVCDQDTFIQSRYRAKCFDIIEHKIDPENLPPGILYEVLADDYDKNDRLVLHDQPILGRNKEMQIYETMYKNFFGISESKDKILDKPNALYITSYPKEGKTRLLEEIIRVTDSSIPVLFITVHMEEQNRPYSLIRKIFSVHFNCELESSTMEERQSEIQRRLKKIKNQKLFWTINGVFQVNFPKSEEFHVFSSADKFSTMIMVLKYLCRKVFRIKWLIVIDDSDNSDENSTEIIELLLHTNTFFLIMASNRDRHSSPFQRSSITKKNKIKTLKLEPIDNNYICAIICQHFRVFAIPCDLQHFIQKNFNGNISYVKHCLDNLCHRKYLEIEEVSFAKIDDSNLICPPLNLIISITDQQMDSFKTLIPQKGHYDNNEFKSILWHNFVGRFHNRFDQEIGKIYEIILKKKTMEACLQVKNLSLNSIPPDLTKQNRMRQLFELLNYSEQLILKCCSLLGDTFSRMALENVLSLEYYPLLPAAIKSFFEIGVICCAQGDFIDGIQYNVIREKITDSKYIDELQCKCRGIYIHDRIKSMPLYAYCGLMRFRSTQVRMILYDQMRENQKIEFHNKVIIILQEETKRCKSCGREPFNWGNTGRLDDHSHKKNKRDSTKFSKRSDDTNPRTTIDDLIYSTSPYFMKYTIGSMRTGSQMSLNSSIFREDITPDNEEFLVINRIFTLIGIVKLEHNVSLIRTFSPNDFTYCECDTILMAFYQDMILHCQGASQLMKLLPIQQKYAYMCISNGNLSEAQLILREASKCINDIFEMEKPPPIWKKKLFEGKILNIQALVYRKLNMRKEEYDCLMLALDKFGVKIPKSKLGRLLQLIRKKLRKMITLFSFPELNTKTLSIDICDYYMDVAKTLNSLAKYFVDHEQWMSAELVATRALFTALTAQTCFMTICNSFTNMIYITLHNRRRSIFLALTVYALKYCYRKMDRVESSELKAVCRMYIAILFGKFLRLDLQYTIHMGYVVLRIAACLNDSEKLLRVASYIVIALLNKLFLPEAISLLLELEYCSENMENIQGQLWFYSQAIVFHLEIGHCVVPLQQGLDILEIHSLKSMSMDANCDDGFYRLTTLIWLWCLRTEQWERASSFFVYINQILRVTNPTIRTVLTWIYILEGKLILYVNKLNKSNIRDAWELRSIVKELFKKIGKELHFMRTHRSKFYILSAYYHLIENNTRKNEKCMRKCMKYAIKYGLKIREGWCNHLRKAWKHELPRKKADFWKDNCEEINVVFYHEFEMNVEDIGFFTLPLPLYV